MTKSLLIAAAIAVSAGVVSASTTTPTTGTPSGTAAAATTSTTTTPPTATAIPTSASVFKGQITSLTPTTVSVKNDTGLEKTFTLGTLKADTSWTVGTKVTAQFNPSTNQLTKVEKN